MGEHKLPRQVDFVMFLISLLNMLIFRPLWAIATATEKQPADGRTAVKFSGIPRTYTPADMHRALKRMGAFKNGDVPLSNGESCLASNPIHVRLCLPQPCATST